MGCHACKISLSPVWAEGCELNSVTSLSPVSSKSLILKTTLPVIYHYRRIPEHKESKNSRVPEQEESKN